MSVIFSVAPMMERTDRHCRFFHRQLSRRALLFTEMIVADAILRGDRNRLLAFDSVERPVSVQLGGSDPVKLAEASRICADFGYDEINLNVGCPSSRAGCGTFGACLMRTPERVGECVSAMRSAVPVPVTVKCRLGVDGQDPGESLWSLAKASREGGAKALWVHARKAWLDGLDPKGNRTIPPLEYEWARRLKSDYPDWFVGLNGGLSSPVEALREAMSDSPPLDGVMLGRAAYDDPSLLLEVDFLFYGEESDSRSWAERIAVMREYAARHIERGGRLLHVSRHMIGLFRGMSGSRSWRRILSEEAADPKAGAEAIDRAFQAVEAIADSSTPASAPSCAPASKALGDKAPEREESRASARAPASESGREPNRKAESEDSATASASASTPASA